MKLNKIAVLMSGGVDSSVAAFLAVEKYGRKNVFGATAKLFRSFRASRNERACCSTDAVSEARAVCDRLGISHHVIDQEKEFESEVIEKFVEAYRHGQTPIPCVSCNTVIKFGSMFEKTKNLGAGKIVTGHYARISCYNSKPDSGKTRYRLLRGKDKEKDQTYFLYRLTQEQLSCTDFLIGEMTKPQVRKSYENLNLGKMIRKESQGICFVGENRVSDYLADKIDFKPGNIVNVKGRVVGQHQGYVLYTVGQRKRVGGGHDKPMYVLELNPLKNEVVIGSEEDLFRKELSFSAPNWIDEVRFPLKCTAKIRYNTNDEKCVVILEKKEGREPKKNKVVFDKPQRAITPGQSIVFYDGEICLGGGTIN